MNREIAENGERRDQRVAQHHTMLREARTIQSASSSGHQSPGYRWHLLIAKRLMSWQLESPV